MKRVSPARFDFDLTAMPVSHDALAYRGRTFFRTDAFVMKNGSKMCERFSDDMPGRIDNFTTV
jgi:hypothetical protein